MSSIVLAGFNLQAQSKDGMVGDFSFDDGNAINAITGKSANAVGVLYVNDRFGNPKSALYLHGSPRSYLNLGTDDFIKPRNVSFAMWLKIEIAVQGGTGYQFNPILLTKNSANDDFYEAYAIAYDFKVKKISAATSLSEKLQVRLNSADTISLNAWHHLVFSFNTDSMFLYLDGALEAKIYKGFVTPFLEGDSVMIGHSANKKNERYLCAAVDDIKIYNRVLSATEVTELYEAPNPNRLKHNLEWIAFVSIFILLIVMIIFLIVRKSRIELRKKELKNALNARMIELETRAMRMQMNPHFMFNALNTLQRFILEEDFENAQGYLSKFSKLLRKVLESSDEESITIEEEIEIIQMYVEIEKLRFGNTFEFTLVNEVTETNRIKIPFMFVQPLVENAIWHGLMHKADHRKLLIHFKKIDEHHLMCIVEDNGVGRSYVNKNRDLIKKKSLALDFIKQRIDIIHKATGIKGAIKIIDKKDDQNNSLGTIVEIIIPII